MAEKKEPLFYRMGQVCEMVDLESHVVRFWETEFPQLSPRKNSAGHRVFTAEDVTLIQTIKRLLHEEGFTIAGAQRKLADGLLGDEMTKSSSSATDTSDAAARREPAAPLATFRAKVVQVRTDLENLLKRLDEGNGFQ